MCDVSERSENMMRLMGIENYSKTLKIEDYLVIVCEGEGKVQVKFIDLNKRSTSDSVTLNTDRIYGNGYNCYFLERNNLCKLERHSRKVNFTLPKKYSDYKIKLISGCDYYLVCRDIFGKEKLLLAKKVKSKVTFSTVDTPSIDGTSLYNDNIIIAEHISGVEVIPLLSYVDGKLCHYSALGTTYNFNHTVESRDGNRVEPSEIVICNEPLFRVLISDNKLTIVDTSSILESIMPKVISGYPEQRTLYKANNIVYSVLEGCEYTTEIPYIDDHSTIIVTSRPYYDEGNLVYVIVIRTCDYGLNDESSE